MARTDGFRTPARTLHWASAVLILATIPAGLVMVTEGLPQTLGNALFIFHKNTGLVIFFLTLWRLVYRLRHPPPPLPTSMPKWQRTVAEGTHLALYLLLLIMAISGYVRVVAGGFPLEGPDMMGLPRIVPRSDSVAEVAKAIHASVRIPLILLIAIHIGAALHHLLILRDGVFDRMTGRWR